MSISLDTNMYFGVNRWENGTPGVYQTPDAPASDILTPQLIDWLYRAIRQAGESDEGLMRAFDASRLAQRIREQAWGELIERIDSGAAPCDSLLELAKTAFYLGWATAHAARQHAFAAGGNGQ